MGALSCFRGWDVPLFGWSACSSAPACLPNAGARGACQTRAAQRSGTAATRRRSELLRRASSMARSSRLTGEHAQANWLAGEAAPSGCWGRDRQVTRIRDHRSACCSTTRPTPPIVRKRPAAGYSSAPAAFVRRWCAAIATVVKSIVAANARWKRGVAISGRLAPGIRRPSVDVRCMLSVAGAIAPGSAA